MTQTPQDNLPPVPDEVLTVVGPETGQVPPASTRPKIDTGLACLVMMARLHGVAADADQLAHEAAVAGHPFGVTDLLLAAKRLELQAKAVKVDVARLAKTPLPAVAVGQAQDGSVDFFILARVDGNQVLILGLGLTRFHGHKRALGLTTVRSAVPGRLSQKQL
jgi:subfamily B ATP-binding cassette protein HlyB/CyaB